MPAILEYTFSVGQVLGFAACVGLFWCAVAYLLTRRTSRKDW